MENKIVAYGTLTDRQKAEAAELILEGFGHLMTFSRDGSFPKESVHRDFRSCIVFLLSGRGSCSGTYGTWKQ